jgi:hypothetical protein
VEEAPIITGYGWHYNLWEFVNAFSHPAEAEKLEFKTKYVFFFVEKIPLRSDKANDPSMIPLNNEDAALPFPNLEGDATEFYYRNPERRALLEAKLNVWAEGYMKKHSDMDVLFEDDAFKVYRWTNPGKEKLNFID